MPCEGVRAKGWFRGCNRDVPRREVVFEVGVIELFGDLNSGVFSCVSHVRGDLVVYRATTVMSAGCDAPSLFYVSSSALSLRVSCRDRSSFGRLLDKVVCRMHALQAEGLESSEGPFVRM